MNFLNLSDDLIGMIEDEVKKHQKYKFRKTLININYNGTGRNLLHHHAVYPINFMSPVVHKFGQSLGPDLVLNYWMMRFIYEALGGYGLSKYHIIQKQQLADLELLDTGVKWDAWQKPDATLTQHINNKGVYFEYDYEPDWDDDDDDDGELPLLYFNIQV